MKPICEIENCGLDQFGNCRWCEKPGIPPPPPPQTHLKVGGCMIPLLIGAAILATAIGVWPSFARAGTCFYPGIITCSVPLNGAPGCNPDAPLLTCLRYDGTAYSMPMFAPPHVPASMPSLRSPHRPAPMPDPRR